MLSKELEISLNMAINEAAQRKHEYVTVEHILYALLFDKDIQEIIEECGGSHKSIQSDLEQFFKEEYFSADLKEGHLPEPTVAFQRVIQRAAQQVFSAGKDKIHCANVMIAIFSEEESYASYFLGKHEIERLDVMRFISHGPKTEINPEESFEPEQSQDTADEGHEFTPDRKDDIKESSGKKSFLSQFTIDLCQRAREGKIDPLVGRSNELERTMQVLCRRRKNNPLFVGDAGVGKTAMAEGLALQIINGKVPSLLANSSIFALDMGA
ncbi:MAG: ATP-dependent Clp protease ATP-binding subunit ClpA, partial [Oligoflexales bacterium]|nr:ATP-dependent Clp protease ATP-binding subunit ClpA [Oligoflexales bacterium]